MKLREQVILGLEMCEVPVSLSNALQRLDSNGVLQIIYLYVLPACLFVVINLVLWVFLLVGQR